jgi:hypothetical protein
VPYATLIYRFPRAQLAIGAAANMANLMVMFDNSRGVEHAFSLVRAPKMRMVLFDARNSEHRIDENLRVCLLT